MRLLCLLFPDLPIALARRAHPHLAERPVALISGSGPDAVVTAVSPAAARSIHPRMHAGEARRLCPGAMFLADNAAECFDELERIASIIRKYATVSVAVASRIGIYADITEAGDELRLASRIRTLARGWSGMNVQAGIGSTRADALEVALSSRRAIAVGEPRLTAEPALRESPGPLSVTYGFDREDAFEARLHKALRNLAVLAATTEIDLREARMTLRSGEEVRTVRLRFDPPTDVEGTEERIAAALAQLPPGTRGRLTIALHRLVPRTLVEPLPTLAMAG